VSFLASRSPLVYTTYWQHAAAVFDSLYIPMTYNGRFQIYNSAKMHSKQRGQNRGLLNLPLRWSNSGAIPSSSK